MGSRETVGGFLEKARVEMPVRTQESYPKSGQKGLTVRFVDGLHSGETVSHLEGEEEAKVLGEESRTEPMRAVLLPLCPQTALHAGAA